MFDASPNRGVACLAVDCSESSLAELGRVFPRQGAVIVPCSDVVECLADETPTAARLALDRQLDGRLLVAGVVGVAELHRSIETPAGREAALGTMRRAVLWARLLLGSMADGGRGGSLVLVPPAATSSADVVVAHGVIGIARSASVSLARDRVRTHVVDRTDGDGVTFATLVAALACADQEWLSGHVLATSAGDIGLLTDEEPLWQLFADTDAVAEWHERVNAFLRPATASRPLPR
jgi:hypothetical protein